MNSQTARPVFDVSVIAIMVFLVAALVARSLVQAALAGRGFSQAVAADLSYLVVPPVLLVLMFPYLKRCRRGLLALLRPADLTVRLIAYSVLLGLLLRLIWWASLMSLVWLGIVGDHGTTAPEGPVLGFQCPPLPALFASLAVMAVLVPLVEETVHRAFIVHALLPRGVLVAVLVSAILFTAVHKSGSYPAAFCGGLFLALQLVNYRTLWGPLFTHATYNASSVIDWHCLFLIWNPAPGDPDYLALVLISIPVAGLGLLGAMLLVGKRAAGTIAPAAPHRTSE